MYVSYETCRSSLPLTYVHSHARTYTPYERVTFVTPAPPSSMGALP